MDEEIKVQVCRLCFKLISDRHFFTINNSLKDIIEVIITDLNLDQTSNPVICRKCFKLVQDIFTFKTNFFENEDRIESNTSVESNIKLDIRDIMDQISKRPTRKKGLIHYCRICLKVIYSEKFFILGSEVKTIINSCIPEMDLQLTENPVICHICLSTLQKIESFKSLCHSNENNINIFTREVGSDSLKKINLHEVLCFLKNRSLRDCNMKFEKHTNGGLSNEKQTCFNNYLNYETEIKADKNSSEKVQSIVDCLQYVLVKMEPSDDEQVPEIKTNLRSKRQIRRIQSKTQRTLGNTINIGEEKSVIHCSECNFKSKNKYRLRHHLITAHKRENIEVNKKCYHCVHCKFSTKWYIDLTRHLLSHLKPDVLKCTKCPYSTNQNSQLIKHILSHVNADNINKYKFLQLTKKVTDL